MTDLEARQQSALPKKDTRPSGTQKAKRRAELDPQDTGRRQGVRVDRVGRAIPEADLEGAHLPLVAGERRAVQTEALQGCGQA